MINYVENFLKMKGQNTFPDRTIMDGPLVYSLQNTMHLSSSR